MIEDHKQAQFDKNNALVQSKIAMKEQSIRANFINLAKQSQRLQNITAISANKNSSYDPARESQNMMLQLSKIEGIRKETPKTDDSTAKKAETTTGLLTKGSNRTGRGLTIAKTPVVKRMTSADHLKIATEKKRLKTLFKSK